MKELVRRAIQFAPSVLE